VTTKDAFRYQIDAMKGTTAVTGAMKLDVQMNVSIHKKLTLNRRGEKIV
jgi:hypothetical protein